jgi:hypothetical protein
MSQADLLENYFKIGYLVSWKRLSKHKKEYGYIQDVFYNGDDKRSFLMVEVIKPGGLKEIFPASYLKLESK